MKNKNSVSNMDDVMAVFVKCKNKDQAAPFFERRSISYVDASNLGAALNIASAKDYAKVFVFIGDCVFEARFFVLFSKILNEIESDKHGELYYLGSENVGPTFSRSKREICVTSTTLNISHHAFVLCHAGIHKMKKVELSTNGVVNHFNIMMNHIEQRAICPSVISREGMSPIGNILKSPILKMVLSKKTASQSDVQNILEKDWQSFMTTITLTLIFNVIKDFIQNTVANNVL